MTTRRSAVEAKGRPKKKIVPKPKRAAKKKSVRTTPALSPQAKQETGPPVVSPSSDERERVSQTADVKPGLESLDADLSEFDDDVGDDFPSDLDDDVSDDIAEDFEDDEGFGTLAEDLGDDLTEDLSEELGTEKYFRDTDAGLDDDDALPRGW